MFGLSDNTIEQIAGYVGEGALILFFLFLNLLVWRVLWFPRRNDAEKSNFMKFIMLVLVCLIASGTPLPEKDFMMHLLRSSAWCLTWIYGFLCLERKPRMMQRG